MKKITAIFLLSIIVPQWCWGGWFPIQSDKVATGIAPSSNPAAILFQEEAGETEDEEELLLDDDDYEWGFWDSYPRLWLVPISLVGFYVGVEQIKRQFDLNNKADDAEKRGDTTAEQKYRDQATVHEVWAVLSLVTATIVFSYGIKKQSPDIFDSMLIDRQGERAYLGLRRSF